MPVAIIINPISGGATAEAARRRAELASDVLASRHEDGEVFVTERRGHAYELASSAARRGVRLVIAWGGDGTVNEVASALAFGETPVGIVPSGSGNGLARDLHIKSDPRLAILEAIAAVPRSIDAGELGGRLFFSVAGVGFDSHVASCFDRDFSGNHHPARPGRRGLAGYVRVTLRELFRYRPSDYIISGDVNRTVRKGMLVTLANSTQFGNGACVAPGARVDDGALDLVMFEEATRAATIGALPRLFTGGALGMRGVVHERIRRVAIECASAMTFHVDGEPVAGGTRLDGRVHPSALRVSVR